MISIGSNSLSIKATILSRSSIEGSGTIKLCNIFDEKPRNPIPGPVTDDIGTVGEILLRHAGFVKKMGAGLYIVTEDEGATVGIRKG